jgi:hypothetical protein
MTKTCELARSASAANAVRWLSASLIVLLAAAIGLSQKPVDSPPTAEVIEGAYKVSLAGAMEYEFRIGMDEKEKPLELRREPVLRWSNPAKSDIQGCVFLWTREGRPLMVGSLHQWFKPRTAWGLIMQHEFHSLAEEPLSAKFHGTSVWKTEEAGVKFVDVPNAGAPAAEEVQRRLQLRKLAKEFAGIARYKDEPGEVELRQLPRPIHSYSAPKQGILEGGLFAFVRGTDPEMFLLVEARGKDAATARWQCAGARMTTQADLRLQRGNKPAWEAKLPEWKSVADHKGAFTAFSFNKIHDFLKEANANLKP